MAKRNKNPKTNLPQERSAVAKNTNQHWNIINHNANNTRHEMRQKLINIGCDKVIMTGVLETKILFSTDNNGNSQKRKKAYNKFQNKIIQLCRDNSAWVVDRAAFPVKNFEISLARCGIYTSVKTLSNHQNACSRCRDMIEAKSIRKAAGDDITATATVINDQNSVAPVTIKPIGFSATATEKVIIEKHYGEDYVRTVKTSNPSTTMDELLVAREKVTSTAGFIEDLIERLEGVADKMDEILTIEKQMKLLDAQIKNIKESI